MGVLAPAASGIVGAVGAVLLGLAGLRSLGERREPALIAIVLCIGGLSAGSAAAMSTVRVDVRAGLMLAVWCAFATGCALCDALTSRIPTNVVRVGVLLSGLLLVATWQLTPVAAGLGSALLLYLAGLLMVRFGSLGRGDARLLGLVGLASGFGSRAGFLVGVCVLVLLPLVQAAWVMARGGSRTTLIPYAPAIVACMLAAVGVPPF